MKKILKKFWAIFISIAMVFSSIVFTPEKLEKNVMAEENQSVVTAFSYDFAYITPGYADGTIRIEASVDGVYKVFWGDEEGNKLTKNGYDYSYLARVIVKDGRGSYNIISDYTVIPEGAKTVLVYKKDTKVYKYLIPEDKIFTPTGEGYTFGALSDFHYGRYINNDYDTAIDTTDNALSFLNGLGLEFVGITGDLTNEGEQISLDKYNETLSKYPNLTVISCTGNHDSRSTVSTSNTALLDTSLIRWYNSLTSTYFTVNDDGTFSSNLKSKYSIPSIGVSRETEYRESAGEVAKTKEIPALDFTVVDGNNVYIFFNEISKTGSVYDVDKLITTEQMDWLASQFETYKNKNVFMYVHSYLAVNPKDNDAVDYNNPVGDLKNQGGYSYDLDFKDYVTTSDGRNMLALFQQYGNVTMFSGHSHWLFAMQEINPHINIGRVNNGNGATLVHLPSVTEPRYIGDTDTLRTELDGEASEGMTVTVYDDCIVYNGVDLVNSTYESYATYMVPTGDNSQFEMIKDLTYTEATDVISGHEYLEAEDMNKMQLLKSTYNLTYGASYVYTSKGSENTDGALTDGTLVSGFLNTRENKNDNQYVLITLDGAQDVSNLKEFQLYFMNDITNSDSFNIQLSLDGEKFETVGSYTNMTSITTVLPVDSSNISLEQFKYIKLNLTGTAGDYGFQISEFAAIGYERNGMPNTAGSSSSVVGGIIDEEELLATDYNLIYAADYVQSSVGTEDKINTLTDGKTSGGFANTERKDDAIDQNFVIDLGIGNTHSVNNIDYFLLYFQNNITSATAFNVSVSLDGEYYESVGSYTDVEYDTIHFEADLSNVTLEEFRYVKLHLTEGNTIYGYQIKEFAVIGANPIEYPEIEDQSSLVSSAEKNLALNKPIYVSSTYINEGKDPTVLTDGKKDKVWSSDWDSARTSEYVIIDLGADVHTSTIGTVLVNHKSDNTFCEDYTIEFSKTYNPEDPTEGFYAVAKTKALTWENLQKRADSNGYVVTKIVDAKPDTIRYVKVNLNGHKPYGYQISEVAVIVKQMKLTDKEAKISIENNEFSYTGKAIEPKITVTYGGIDLTEGTDYTVSYDNNINIGEASYTVVGSETYSGTVRGKFTITAKPINEVDMKIYINENGELVVSGTNGSALVEGVDYSYTQTTDNKNNIVVTVTAMGEKYTGILTKTIYDINNANIFDIKEVAYTGEEVKANILITFNGKLLVENQDYTVEYLNNVEVGTAIAVIRGLSINSSFTGMVEKTFDIVEKEGVTTPKEDTTEEIIVKKPNGLVHIPFSDGSKSYYFLWENVDDIEYYNLYIDDIHIDMTTNAFYDFGSTYFTELGSYSISVTAVGKTGIESEKESITFIVLEDSTTSIAISQSVIVEGYQISHILEGSRVIGSVEPVINDKEVVKWGFIYAITQADDMTFNISDADMYIGTVNNYVASMESTDNGTISNQMGASDTATYFVRTTLFGSKNKSEFTASYKVRAYAELEDGTYVYSEVAEYSVYDVADDLYQNKMMDTNSAHEYLHNNILTVVDSYYKIVDYNWNNAISKPKKK